MCVARGRRWTARVLLVVGLLVAGAVHAAAQTDGSLVDHLGLDKLQIVSLGVAGGWIMPSQVEATKLVAASADYGELAPSWHIVFNASFWSSRYRASVVQTFVDSLNRNLSGQGSARVAASPISVYDAAFGADVRYTPNYSGELKPFFGVGVALHVINAEGALIKGTFVERALDEIGGGTYLTGGVSFKIVKHLGVEAGVRGDLLSGFRSVQARAGATYFFGHVREAILGGSP